MIKSPHIEEISIKNGLVPGRICSCRKIYSSLLAGVPPAGLCGPHDTWIKAKNKMLKDATQFDNPAGEI
jgi:hypothetical protein